MLTYELHPIQARREMHGWSMTHRQPQVRLPLNLAERGGTRVCAAASQALHAPFLAVMSQLVHIIEMRIEKRFFRVEVNFRVALKRGLNHRL